MTVPLRPTGRGRAEPADATAVQHQLPEAREVARRDAQSAVRECEPGGIDGDDGIVLGADGRPELVGEELGVPPTRRALEHPGEHVGGRRAVLEARAVPAVGSQRAQERVRGLRVVRMARAPAGRTVLCLNLGARVCVLLAEPDGGGHVEQLADGRVAVGAVPQLRHVRPRRCVDLDHAALDERAGQGAAERLGDRLQQMLRVAAHPVEVRLVADPPVAKHEERVGVGVPEELVERRCPGDFVERQPVEVLELDRELEHRAVAARDRRRRHDRSDVLERPAVERALLPVREGHEPIGIGRRALHEAELLGGCGRGPGGHGALSWKWQAADMVVADEQRIERLARRRVAELDPKRAPRVEPAPGRDRPCRRRLALQGRRRSRGSPHPGRGEREERTRVRVPRGLEHCPGRPLLDDAAQVHDGDPVAR